MYTAEDVRAYIGNGTYFARGRVMASEGRVGQITERRRGDQLRVQAAVRGLTGQYACWFTYDEDRDLFLNCGCDCPAIDWADSGCKHVAALMLVYAKTKKGEDRKSELQRRLAEQQNAWNRQVEEAERRAAQAAQARMQLEQTWREKARSGMVEALCLPPEGLREEPLHLRIILEADDAVPENTLGLQLKLGRTREYSVPSIRDLIDNVENRSGVTYGKDLTTDHGEEEFSPEDWKLLMALAMLRDCCDKRNKKQMIFSGKHLDYLMHLLEGRTVTLRTAAGETEASVERGKGQPGLAVEQTRDGLVLRYEGGLLLVGYAGAYFPEPENGRILCVFGQDFARLRSVLRLKNDFPSGLSLRPEELDDLGANLLNPARGLVRIIRGEELVEPYIPDPMTVRFYVDMPEDGSLDCRTRFVYKGREMGADDNDETIRRDRPEEKRVLEAVQRIFPDSRGNGEYTFSGSDDDCFKILSRELDRLKAFGEVMITARLAGRNLKTRRPVTLGIQPESGGLLAHSDMGGITQEDAESALAAYRQKRRYVRLKDGTFLSEEALTQAAEMAQLMQGLGLTAKELAEGARLPAARALYLEQAVKERPEMTLSAAPEVTDWMDRFRRAQQTTVQPPAGLRAELKPYQLEGLAWLRALNDAGFGGILADDMGLGKTIQTLALLLQEKEAGRPLRALIVCPASLQLNWRSEAARFTPDLDVLALLGSAESRMNALSDDHEVIITSYTQVGRDAARYSGMHFTHIILDEAQNIKNASAQSTKAVKSLTGDHRFALTGTPIENRLAELWSIFDFLMPGYLYRYPTFKARYESPIVKDKDEDARRNLRLLTAPFILRRMKQDVLDDLPEKIEKTISCDMTPIQRRLYQAKAAELVDCAEREPNSSGKLWEGMLRLRQLCCDPALFLERYNGGSGKLDACMTLIGECLAEGHRILLFSQFTSMLGILDKALTARGIETFMLTGETPKEARLELADRFNEGEGQVFLISLKAGGTGLNLTGADTVIHYDPWWNFAAQNQATDRAYRIGQQKGVCVYRLITVDTMEERILELQGSKQALSDGILSGDETLFTLNADLLRDLLREGS